MILEGIDRDINIKDLSVEPPVRQPESRLDEILKLTPNELIEIKVLNNFRLMRDDLRMKVGLRFLYPKMEYHSVTALDDSAIWHNSLGFMELAGNQGNLDLYLATFANLKMLYPERSEELVISDATWQWLLLNLKSLNDNKRLVEFLDAGYQMKIIAPKRVEDIYNINPEVPQFFQTNPPLLHGYLLTKGYALQAFCRILYPELDDSVKIGSSALEDGVNLLKGLKLISWSKFVELAFNLKVITADGVKVTENGLEIIDHKSSMDFTNNYQLPVRRAF